jgi:1-acyl-sn-glycerol-3-phosphate acyltransferase
MEYNEPQQAESMNSYHQAVVKTNEGLKKFFSAIYKENSVEGPALDPQKIQQNPLMLVSTHRSHIDYFYVGTLFSRLGFKNLRFAAGDNLTTLPWIGKKFINFGAFTVARDTGFDRNYVRNLCNNAVTMIENGDIILVFPEGGRSYSGAMLEMRIGILGAAVLSQAKDLSRDVYYIPVAVSYEFPPEVPWFAMQLKGKAMRKRGNPLPVRLIGNLLYFGADIRTFLPVFFAPKLHLTYGSIFVDYGEPVSVRSVVDIVANRIPDARDEFSAHRVSMQKLSDAAFRQLYKLYRVLPMHVVAAQLKQHGSRTLAELADAFPGTIAYLKTKERNVKQLEKSDSAVNAGIGVDRLRAIGAVRIKGGVCTVRNKALVDYFAATID